MSRFSMTIIQRNARFLISDGLPGARRIHTSYKLLRNFYERTKKSSYPHLTDEKLAENKSLFDQICTGAKILKTETRLWLKETFETLRMDPVLMYRRNEVDVAWSFDKENSVNQFVVTCDSDYKQGYSTAKFENTSRGTAVFSGVLSTRKPKDGNVRYSGYCNLTSVPKRKSFHREEPLKWDMYSHIVLRIKGDGRCYVLNLLCQGIFDISWNDVYHYALYTRGGPYWQYVKIPFSRFVFSSKGRVQDVQSPVPLDVVKRLGITLGDDVNGAFRLEIDYIGLEFDALHFEKNAYETYNMQNVHM